MKEECGLVQHTHRHKLTNWVIELYIYKINYTYTYIIELSQHLFRYNEVSVYVTYIMCPRNIYIIYK